MRNRIAGMIFVGLLLAGCQPAAPSPAPAAPKTTVGPAETRPPEAPSKLAPAAQKPTAVSAVHSPSVQRLLQEARAKGEAELGLTWSETSLGGSEGMKHYEALMNRMYGTNIKINFTPGPSHPDMAAKTIQEVAAGVKTSTDVLFGTETHYTGMVDRDALESFDYAQLSPRVSAGMVAPNNVGVQIATVFGQIAYSTNLVTPAEVPKKLEDVLNPKWKGKVAASDVACNLDRISVRPEWSAEKMKTFVRSLSQQAGGLIRAGNLERIAIGEFAMMVFDCGGHLTRVEKEKGAPVDGVVPADAATMSFRYLGVPRTAEHPNLAKLFINAVLSEEGQKIAYEMDHSDHHALPGSNLAAVVSEFKARGINFLEFDVQFSRQQPGLRELQGELQRILRDGG